MAPLTGIVRFAGIAALCVLLGCAHSIGRADAAGAMPAFRSEKAMQKALRNGRVAKTEYDAQGIAQSLAARDVAYGDDPAQRLDVYRVADSARPAPVLLFIHGGAWDHGDKAVCGPYAARFSQLGYLSVSINYRLAPAATYPAAVEDVRAALRWVRAHSAEFGGDPTRIALAGQSAGAHLALLAAYTDTEPGLRCVVDFYGPADLTTRQARRSTEVRRFIGSKYRHATPRFQEASPIRYITASSAPTLILHGDIDEQVPLSQSENLASALTGAGVAHDFVIVHGWGHAMDRAAPVFDRCAHAMQDFLAAHLQ